MECTTRLREVNSRLVFLLADLHLVVYPVGRANPSFHPHLDALARIGYHQIVVTTRKIPPNVLEKGCQKFLAIPVLSRATPLSLCQTGVTITSSFYFEWLSKPPGRISFLTVNHRAMSLPVGFSEHDFGETHKAARVGQLANALLKREHPSLPEALTTTHKSSERLRVGILIAERKNRIMPGCQSLAYRVMSGCQRGSLDRIFFPGYTSNHCSDY